MFKCLSTSRAATPARIRAPPVCSITPFAENAIVLGIDHDRFTTIINVMGVSLLSKINNIGVASELVGAAGVIILFLIHTTRSSRGGAHQPPRIPPTSIDRLGLPWCAAGGCDHAAVRDVRLRFCRVTGRGDRRSAAQGTTRRLSRRWRPPERWASCSSCSAPWRSATSLYKDPTALGLAVITKDVLGDFWGDVFLWGLRAGDLRLLSRDPRDVGADPVCHGPG